jgi:hypothetical protein
VTVVAAFTYPWDILGDPRAPARLRELGADTAVLAAAYHSTTAITPRHPRHRVFHAPHSAVYYPPAAERWRGAALRPAAQRWCGTADAYGRAAAQLRDAGLDVHAWVVVAHNSRLARAFPRHAVRNAYGDPSGWALCIAQSEVRGYAATLAAEAATRPGTSGVELESCGWYGHDHRHAHDKAGGVPFREAGQYLLSLCFCPVCRDGYAACGADPGLLRRTVRGALEPLWCGGQEAGRAGDGDDWAAVRGLLGPDLADATLRYRLAAAREFQHAVVGAIRAQAGPGCRVVLHADLVPHRTGANPGVLVGDVLAVADGLVIRAGAVPRAGPLPSGAVLAANHQIISAMGGDPNLRPPAGATEIRLYHPGLAPERDLRVVAAAVARYRDGAPHDGTGGGAPASARHDGTEATQPTEERTGGTSH